jgi:hypothetical protein
MIFLQYCCFKLKTNDRLLWVNFDDKSIYEALLPLGIVSEVVGEFLEGFSID